jgi:SagB-type dehydrogenase family enzyme
MKVDKQNAGEAFQGLTKYSRDDMPRGGLDWDARPARHKRYDEPLGVVELPAPVTEGGGELWVLLAKRRTRRTYTSEPLGMDDISQLLWAADGKTREGRDNVLRTAPSAGALYPVELYLMANRVDGLEPGIYHYGVPGHTLSLIRRGDCSEEAASGSLGQAMLAKSAAVVFMSAVVGRSSWKYAQRAYRYIYLDAGHIAQNICLACESMHLGVCPIGAFYDDELNSILGIDGVDETVLYAMTIGR